MSVTSTTLLDVLGATAPNRELTARKTAHIMERDGSEITGFVVTDKHGEVGIIDKSAVRWLYQERMDQLMHGPQYQSTSNTPGQARHAKVTQ